MKILITGSNGFVGKHLVRSLEESGHELIHLVREKKGSGQEILWNFTSSLPDNIPQCKILIHLAAYVDFSKKLSVEQYTVNTVATAILAKYCQDNNAGLIFTSTIGVCENLGFYSEDSEIKPADNYSLSKLLAEQIINAFNCNGYILRIGGIYGVDGPAHLGINKAMKNAMCLGQIPILYGSGVGKRNYISVIDVVRWINHCINELECKKNNKMNTLYIGGPEILSIREYLELICKFFIPDKTIIIKDGNDVGDAIIDSSSPPFEMVTFRHYLEIAKHDFFKRDD